MSGNDQKSNPQPNSSASPFPTHSKLITHNFSRASIWLIYTCTFFYWMAMYLYVPILPVYAESLGASLTVVGIIVAAYSIPQLLLRIPLGIWSDYLGRQKPLILGGAAMIILASIGLALSPNPALLAVFRSLVGVGAAVWVVFPVYVVTFYTEEKMSQAVGILNFITGISLVTASLLGGVVTGAKSEKFVFFMAAGMAAAAFITLKFAGEHVVSHQESFSWRKFNDVARRPLLIVVAVMATLVLFADYSSIFGFVPVYAANIGASDTTLGILTMLNMIGSMLGSLAVAPLVKRLGNFRSILISSILLGLTLLAVPFIHSVPILGADLLLHGLGYGIMSTTLMVLAMYKISPQQRATAMGFYQALYSIGMLTGPLISGVLSDRHGLPVVFYLGGTLCLLTATMAFLPFFPGRQKEQVNS